MASERMQCTTAVTCEQAIVMALLLPAPVVPGTYVQLPTVKLTSPAYESSACPMLCQSMSGSFALLAQHTVSQLCVIMHVWWQVCACTTASAGVHCRTCCIGYTHSIAMKCCTGGVR
jgi:hypothetical protein